MNVIKFQISLLPKKKSLTFFLGTPIMNGPNQLRVIVLNNTFDMHEILFK
jgi:hypothetical protein